MGRAQNGEAHNGASLASLVRLFEVPPIGQAAPCPPRSGFSGRSPVLAAGRTRRSASRRSDRLECDPSIRCEGFVPPNIYNLRALIRLVHWSGKWHSSAPRGSERRASETEGPAKPRGSETEGRKPRAANWERHEGRSHSRVDDPRRLRPPGRTAAPSTVTARARPWRRRHGSLRGAGYGRRRRSDSDRAACRREPSFATSTRKRMSSFRWINAEIVGHPNQPPG